MTGKQKHTVFLSGLVRNVVSICMKLRSKFSYSWSRSTVFSNALFALGWLQKCFLRGTHSKSRRSCNVTTVVIVGNWSWSCALRLSDKARRQVLANGPPHWRISSLRFEATHEDHPCLWIDLFPVGSIDLYLFWIRLWAFSLQPALYIL